MKEILIISTIGSLLTLDSRAIGRFILYEPLFGGLIIGALLKNIELGLTVGSFFQLIWINRVHGGNTTPVDSLFSTIVAIYFSYILFTSTYIDKKAVIVLSVSLGIPIGFIAKWLEIRLKEIFDKFADIVDLLSQKANYKAITRIIFFAIVIEGIKGFLLCFIFLSIGRFLLPKLVVTLPINIIIGMKLMYWLIIPIGVAVMLNMFLSEGYTKLVFTIMFLSLILIFILNIPREVILIIGITMSLICILIRLVYKSYVSKI